MTVAPAPFAAAFAGTLDTSADATTRDHCRHCGKSGARGRAYAVIANAHHDPAHVEAIRAAVARRRGRCNAIVFPDLTTRKWAERLTDEFRSGACHAGRYEGSIVLARRRRSSIGRGSAPCRANPQSLVDAIRRGRRRSRQAGGPEAYFGWPAEATAIEGQEIISRLGDLVADAVAEYTHNRSSTDADGAGGRNGTSAS